MTTTQFKTAAPIGEQERKTCSAVQWMLERSTDDRSPPFQRNNLKLFICGEEAFEQIAKDIKAAKSSIEIICWGFDPAMELVRSGSVWPRGDTWGGLLMDVAEGKYNDNRPVQVRVLSWYGFIGNHFTNNMPGYRGDDDRLLKNEALWKIPLSRFGRAVPPLPGVDPKDHREYFNARWYRLAMLGQLKNVSVRTRDMSSSDIDKSLREELGPRGFAESQGMKRLATDHQKTILIDYDHGGGADAVGYVMGLNSVTDYWDTPRHSFRDPRRGAAWEGAGDSEPGLKPYQDYACRIRGAALVAVSKNFCDAWNRAKGLGSPLVRSHDLQKPPAGLTSRLEGPNQRAMIVRTQPEEGEKSIKRLYEQASSFARNYLYVENQYFQYTEWAQQLKRDRQAYVDGWKAKGKRQEDLPDLHVMVVIPTPERVQMVPRTHDTITTLGSGGSMPEQDKLVAEELKRHEKQQARWDEHVRSSAEKGELPDPDMAPVLLSEAAQGAKAVGNSANLMKEAETLGLRTLVASLWTFDHDWRATQRRELEAAQASAPTAVDTQRRRLMSDKLTGARYREIYIHSKLMLIDDSMFTLGSANLNLRSMAVDAEINIASDDEACSADLRRRVWDLHTGGAEGCNPKDLKPRSLAAALNRWKAVMSTNADKKTFGGQPIGFLFPFHDERTSSTRLG